VKGLPSAVVLSLGTSLLVAQIFTPWVATFLLRKQATVPDVADAVAYDRTDDRLEGPAGERNPALRLIRRGYTRAIPWVVAHPGLVVIGFVLLLGGALSLFRVIGVQFFPKADKGVLFVSLQLPNGSRLERVEEKLGAATELLRRDPAVTETSAVVGGTFPAVFSSRIGPPASHSVADILVKLERRADSSRVATRLRETLASLPGVKVRVDELSYGPPVRHPIFVRIFGDEHAKLRSHAEQIKARLAAIPGVINIDDSLTETVPTARVRIDVDKALRHGVTPAQVGQSLRWLYGQDKVTEFRRGDDLVEVILDRAPEPARPLEALENTPIPAVTSALVPLRETGTTALAHDFATISRRNARRLVEVWADVGGKTLASNVIAELDPWLRDRRWEPGYGFAYAGEEEETRQAFAKLGVAAIGALILIFLLLLLLFDNLLLSGIVVLAVPFALLGALPGLALTGNAFGFMAFLGLIALIGVYVNHKIYFVDRMLELTNRGERLPDAVLHAGQDRLRPVVLTALTAVLGLVPLTLGGGRMWSSFGWVNIFGLMVSIPLSLVLLPALIVLALRLTGRWRRWERQDQVRGAAANR